MQYYRSVCHERDIIDGDIVKWESLHTCIQTGHTTTNTSKLKNKNKVKEKNKNLDFIFI